MKTVFTLLLFLSTAAHGQHITWQSVEKIFGRKGAVQGNVFTVTFARTDLKVNVGTVTIEPGLALASSISFLQEEDRVMMMGTFVLLEREIRPAMKALLNHNLEVTALHNHITGESPKIMYMHVSGYGNANKLATMMVDVLSKTKTPIKNSPGSGKTAQETDWTKVEQIIGSSGKRSGKTLTISIPRAETIRKHQLDIPPAMGMATTVNFQMIGRTATTTGGFVLTAEEVQPVLQTLQKHNIAVTAIHNEMIFESPRLFFMHFWGVDEPKKLALGIRAALEKTHSLL